jgi:ribosome-binding protein aMBF1 (putative translation factor)
MKTIPSSSESSRTTETWPPSFSHSTITTGTVAPFVVSRHVPPSELRKVKRNFVDIDDLVAREESTPEGKAGIERARLELAKEMQRKSGTTLKGLRLSKGLSQARLAVLMDTSQPYIARLEAAGADPQVSTIIRFAAALGIDPHEALDAVIQDRKQPS